MKTVGELFDVKYGHSYELCHLEEDPNGIPFVSRTSANNGVSARVKHTGEAPTPAGALTVALGGSVLSTFLQPVPCYEGFHVAILTPKHPMTDEEKLWYACAIRANRYRFSYGRQANRELPSLQLPPPPKWVSDARIPDLSWAMKSAHGNTGDRATWRLKSFRLSEIGLFQRGERLTTVNMVSATREEGGLPHVAATRENNGVVARCLPRNQTVFPAGSITITNSGSVGIAFLQPEPFTASDHVTVLMPNVCSHPGNLYICSVLQLEKYRYSFGREWNIERMKTTTIHLPERDGKPDYEAMERFILGCSYSAILKTPGLRGD